jgi:hypothetical protein
VSAYSCPLQIASSISFGSASWTSTIGPTQPVADIAFPGIQVLSDLSHSLVVDLFLEVITTVYNGIVELRGDTNQQDNIACDQYKQHTFRSLNLS